MTPPLFSIMPMRAGIMNTARSAWPTLEEWASPAELVTSALGALSASRRTASSSLAAGTQVISSTFSGGYWAARSASPS